MAKEAEKTQIPDIEQRHLAFPVEIRVEGEGKAKKLVGYAAVFNSVTDIGWFREQIEPGCFSDTIEDDDIRGLFNHDSNLILGRNKAKTLRLKEDSKGLWFEIDVPDTQVGRDTLTSVERGDVSGCSFAFQTLADAWDYSDEDSPFRTLKKVRLFDVGPVTYPAYPDTSVAARSLEAAKKAQKPAETREQLSQTPTAAADEPRATGHESPSVPPERQRAIARSWRSLQRRKDRNDEVLKKLKQAEA